jgi:hypothetical protein
MSERFTGLGCEICARGRCGSLLPSPGFFAPPPRGCPRLPSSPPRASGFGPLRLNPGEQPSRPDGKAGICRTRGPHQVSHNSQAGFRGYPPSFGHGLPYHSQVGPPQRRTAPPAPGGFTLRHSRHGPRFAPPSFPRSPACHSTAPGLPGNEGSRVLS